ncbi:MAG: hypothetical protein PWP07_718 [Epulopiscium sp.]|jgi:hypothetical protein|uniref:Uncharacterized protein n=1 Tax=Defluviitalea raffinosedens TaxID=1450156 RepID=A0A7C8LDF6_9FIRM|nr:hypothetical protein [Defluviitalea raffinosedens]MBZ4668150.1 hypothetical protein [Defluviitaleaceae bacterium]MDK2787493.1 hypothetical protein [Candidatus Epulonipiscium sp.]KAE9631398.1 hypothetical protein GND95_11630 [Defluviitalea raffinosedens]MBM7684831.1 hypothetical protein [Defluviitalea raffinosedens]HHW67066.1 hypothetical protein [Candidatus Epulonipiscium sp.]
MDSSQANQFCKHTFLQVYQRNIEEKLQKIDLFLKTSPKKLNIHTTSELLNISEEEIKDLMLKYNISSINPASFFMIMVQGSSYICGLLRRELQRGSKNVYTVEDIAYIYQLNPQKIMDAMAESNINEITSENIKTLFEYIPVQIWE